VFAVEGSFENEVKKVGVEGRYLNSREHRNDFGKGCEVWEGLKAAGSILNLQKRAEGEDVDGGKEQRQDEHGYWPREAVIPARVKRRRRRK
jgi:hypothetical protein